MNSTGLRILETDWDRKRGRAKSIISKAVEYSALNQRLDDIEKTLIEYRAAKLLSPCLSRAELSKVLHPDPQEANPAGMIPDAEQTVSEFFNLWANIIKETKTKKGIPITASTKATKLQTLELVKEFVTVKQIHVSLETLDMTFYKLLDQYMQSKKFSENTCGKHFKEIKSMMREAADRDYKVNSAFQKKSFQVIQIDCDTIYLDENDLKKIIQADLNDELARLRDIFICACFVGARHSDWHQIHPRNILFVKNKTLLKIRQLKTREVIHIPVHPVVSSIFKKYGSNLPEVPSNSLFNKALKEISQIANLGEVEIDGEILPKWTQVSTHTARRSFATNAYLSGSMEVHQIMKCTGHKTEKSFLRYIRLNGKDFAIQAADSSFFTNTSYSMVIA